MKNTLLKNQWELTLYVLGVVGEFILRLIRLSLPLGLYKLMLQMQNKPRTTTAMHTYLTDDSTYMFIMPGVVMVNVDGREYKKSIKLFEKYWKKNSNTYFIGLQVVAYTLAIIYFLRGLIF